MSDGTDASRHSSPVALIGLDAFDPATALRFIEQGELPNIAAFLKQASHCTVRNPFGVFIGGVWFSFATGLRPDRHGQYSWEKIDLDSYRYCEDPLRPSGDPTLWQSLSEGGRRVVVVDVPHAKAQSELNGVQIAEWGCHDRHFGFHCCPPERSREISERFGYHPAFGLFPLRAKDFASDDHLHRSGLLRTAEEEKRLLQGLKQGLAAKTRMLTSLAKAEKWDLFLGVFGECHAVGHQQWHLHDQSHPRFDQGVQDRLGGDPVLQIYRAIDAGLGEVLAAIGPDTPTFLLLSHGMGPHHDGAHLLDEVLRRLDLQYRDPSDATRKTRMVARAIKAVAPSLRRLVSRLAIPARLRTWLARLLDASVHAGQRAHQLFFAEPSNFVYGGVRLNLAGREARGLLNPADVDTVCARLEEDLLALINLDTGRPAVRAVIRADSRYRRSPRDTLPDLFLDWDRTAPIERLSSPKIGTVEMKYAGWRTGDHREEGLLLVRGAEYAPDTQQDEIRMEDLAPSIAARLGVKMPGVDGRVVPWLAGHKRMAGSSRSARTSRTADDPLPTEDYGVVRTAL